MRRGAAPRRHVSARLGAALPRLHCVCGACRAGRVAGRAWSSALLSCSRGGTPSTTQPTPPPWLSPKVVTRKAVPKVLASAVVTAVAAAAQRRLSTRARGDACSLYCSARRVRAARRTRRAQWLPGCLRPGRRTHRCAARGVRMRRTRGAVRRRRCGAALRRGAAATAPSSAAWRRRREGASGCENGRGPPARRVQRADNNNVATQALNACEQWLGAHGCVLGGADRGLCGTKIRPIKCLCHATRFRPRHSALRPAPRPVAAPDRGQGSCARAAHFADPRAPVRALRPHSGC